MARHSKMTKVWKEAVQSTTGELLHDFMEALYPKVDQKKDKAAIADGHPEEQRVQTL